MKWEEGGGGGPNEVLIYSHKRVQNFRLDIWVREGKGGGNIKGGERGGEVGKRKWGRKGEGNGREMEVWGRGVVKKRGGKRVGGEGALTLTLPIFINIVFISLPICGYYWLGYTSKRYLPKWTRYWIPWYGSTNISKYWQYLFDKNETQLCSVVPTITNILYTRHHQKSSILKHIRYHTKIRLTNIQVSKCKSCLYI